VIIKNLLFRVWGLAPTFGAPEGRPNRRQHIDQGIEFRHERQDRTLRIPNPTNHLTSALGLSRLGSNDARQTLGENLPLALPISAAEAPEAEMKANGLALPSKSCSCRWYWL
jgi:hypothetical protein